MSKSTPLYDDSPALVGGQSKLPDVVQKAIIKKKMKTVKEKKAYIGLARHRAIAAYERKKKKKKKRGMYKVAAHGAQYDDSHMLSKSLERMAAQAIHLKQKMDCGLVLPSWAEYKIYKAYDSINSALGASYPGHYPMGADTSKMMGSPSPMILKEASGAKRMNRVAQSLFRKYEQGKTPSKEIRDLYDRLSQGRAGDRVMTMESLNQMRKGDSGVPKTRGRYSPIDLETLMFRQGREAVDQPSEFLRRLARHPRAAEQYKESLRGAARGYGPGLRKKASVEQEVLKALTDEGGAAGMGAIKKRVSSPELAAAVKRLMAQGKIHKHRDGDIIKK